jgi:hypothetical protein
MAMIDLSRNPAHETLAISPGLEPRCPDAMDLGRTTAKQRFSGANRKFRESGLEHEAMILPALGMLAYSASSSSTERTKPASSSPPSPLLRRAPGSGRPRSPHRHVDEREREGRWSHEKAGEADFAA